MWKKAWHSIMNSSSILGLSLQSNLLQFICCICQNKKGGKKSCWQIIDKLKILQARGDHHRDVCIIPLSAHGTNPASAAMCGMKIVSVGTDSKGNINIAELKKAAEANKENLSALMVRSDIAFFDAGRELELEEIKLECNVSLFPWNDDRLHILPLMECMKKALMRFVRSFMRMEVKSIWMEPTWTPRYVWCRISNFKTQRCSCIIYRTNHVRGRTLSILWSWFPKVNWQVSRFFFILVV